MPLPPLPLVHKRFEACVERGPNRLALTCGASQYTYAELDAAANRLAHALCRRGVERGAVVGVCVDRSPELVIGVLAILKAGAAYSPLDPTYPEPRLTSMTAQLPDMRWVLASDETRRLVESSPAMVIVQADIEAELATLPSIAPNVGTTGDDLSYVVFTSGSTGLPKAAAVRHVGWYNLLAWLEATFGLDSTSTNLMLSPFGFDISQRSLLAPLFTGATLHLLPSRHFDAMLAHRMIQDLQVRTLHCAPSALYLLADRHMADGATAPTSLECVFPGGEPLSAARLAPWMAGPGRKCTVVNVYGVAECTDISTFHVLADRCDTALSAVPIGRPIHNVDVHLLGPDLTAVEDTQVGEICITGTGVGAGYIGRAGEDDGRFVTLRTEEAPAEIYRTGDRGRIQGDGQLAYVGRIDDQIKIRGMRFDSADVEAALRATSSVSDSVVVAVPRKRTQDVELVALVVPRTRDASGAGAINQRALRAELASKLPPHMVPMRFVTATEIPLNPNGKVDRRAIIRHVS